VVFLVLLLHRCHGQHSGVGGGGLIALQHRRSRSTHIQWYCTALTATAASDILCCTTGAVVAGQYHRASGSLSRVHAPPTQLEHAAGRPCLPSVALWHWQTVRAFSAELDALITRLGELDGVMASLLRCIEGGTAPPEQLNRFARLLQSAADLVKVVMTPSNAALRLRPSGCLNAFRLRKQLDMLCFAFVAFRLGVKPTHSLPTTTHGEGQCSTYTLCLIPTGMAATTPAVAEVVT
jgi:hypothetical protein